MILYAAVGFWDVCGGRRMARMLTDKELQEIEARCEAAVPPPWEYDGMHYEITAPYNDDAYWLIASECRTRPDGPYECDQFGHEFDPTFDFIAHARTDVPDLLAEVRRLQELQRAGDAPCIWTEGEDGYYDTACGGAFAITDGTPEENDMAWCPYCGRRLVVKSSSGEDANA